MRYTQEDFDDLLNRLSALIEHKSWSTCIPLVEELKQSIMIKLR